MPSILLVGWDDVSLEEATPAVCPRLAAFRASAMDNVRAYSHPVCSQSRAAILFGSYGKRIGTIADIGTLEPTAITPPLELPTLPGALRAAGYATALVGKWHCGPCPNGQHWARAPIQRGYDVWRAGSRLNLNSPPSSGYTDWQRVDADAVAFALAFSAQHSALAQLNAAAAWWDSKTGTKKRFLHVALNLPHAPFHAPPLELLAGWPMPTPGSSNRAKYLAMLRAADTAFGRLLDLVGDEAAVFLYSDNGTSPRALAPGGDESHAKETTFEGGIRVLCLGRWNGCPTGPHDGLVHVLDLAAGVCAVAGVTPPSSWDAQTTPRTFVLSEALKSNGETDRACRTSTHKLRELSSFLEGVREELYHLESDPLELHPLDLEDPENLEALTWLRARLVEAAL